MAHHETNTKTLIRAVSWKQFCSRKEKPSPAAAPATAAV